MQNKKVKMEKVNRIKAARLAAGLSQREMSELLRIPKNTITGWEQGRRTPPEYVERLIIEKLNSTIKIQKER
ncbi:helix-turn-helix domain-containing protein [Dialister invisus]